MLTTSRSRRATTLSSFALLAIAFMTGCSTDSPPQHSERLQKAAGLKVFYVETSKELWEKTSDQEGRDGPDLEIKSTSKDLDNGLVQVALTGVSLTNYLRVLDYMGHGGADSKNFGKHRQAESIRMYNEISGVLDDTTKRPDPKDPPLRAVVDDAFVEAKSK
ncbi:hypothetical protein ACIOJD_33645 [Streptomyces sp. NPDC088116]|uniref:hypothetical protein n=1 Tax=Streptomyces sp. NPDC088116 TaxID=3365825 RepID=UPI00380D14BC